jgi:hypothetical protein
MNPLNGNLMNYCVNLGIILSVIVGPVVLCQG